MILTGELHQALALWPLAKMLRIPMGMRPLFPSTRASRAWHISSGRIAHLRFWKEFRWGPAHISHHVASRGPRDVVRCGVFDLEARPGPPVPSADGACEPRSRRQEEVDARASSTTSNEEIGRDPHRPGGLRRHGPAFFVAAPRRWRTSRSSRRLESGAMALATDGAGGSGRTSQGAEAYLTVRRAPRGEKTPQIATYSRAAVARW